MFYRSCQVGSVHCSLSGTQDNGDLTLTCFYDHYSRAKGRWLIAHWLFPEEVYMFLLSFHVISKGQGSTFLPCSQNKHQEICGLQHQWLLVVTRWVTIWMKKKLWGPVMRTLLPPNLMKLNFEFFKIYNFS